MIAIYIFADSHKHFSSIIEEYLKRLGKHLELIELKPVKKWTPEMIIKNETKLFQEKIKSSHWYKILLSQNGTNISTWDFSQLLESRKDRWESIIFFIGGANGLDYDMLRDEVDMELSLGAMTLPHSLALSVLLEQIYRASEIQKGSKYHK